MRRLVCSVCKDIKPVEPVYRFVEINDYYLPIKLYECVFCGSDKVSDPVGLCIFNIFNIWRY